jgi:DNA repair protein RecN (Recombination protein N)
MIKEMRIKNYALLNEVEIIFDNGFNVLTGSTGTGKSIIINALSLLLGEKGDIGSIRRKEDKAIVEGVFTRSERIDKLLESNGIPIDEELIIRRIINRKGGGGIYINGSIANLRILREISKLLFDIHGQHEHQLLLNEETHIDFLDAYGKLLTKRKEVADLYHKVNQLKSALDKKTSEREEISKKKELYEFQKKELDSLTLTPTEYEGVKEEKKILDNFEEISMIVLDAIAKIDESESPMLATLTGISEELKKASNFDRKLIPVSKRITESDLILQDALLDLSRYRDSLDYDRERLGELEEIIDKIENLKKKYSCDYPGLIELKSELENKIYNIDFLTEEIEALKESIGKEETKLLEKAVSLSEERTKISTQFKGKVEEELKDLGFEKAHFGVEIKDKKDIDEKGKDRVCFLFEPNIGEGWEPFSKIASGGELSRVMLALKSILSDVDEVEGVVFDEIDSGIGGTLGKRIGEKMRKIGHKRQVLCVTHLPNIASEANFHIQVDKKAKDGRTITSVRTVGGKERIKEIARMLSGDSSRETAIKHAKELLREA